MPQSSYSLSAYRKYTKQQTAIKDCLSSQQTLHINQNSCWILTHALLTHWGRDKIDAISKTTFSSALFLHEIIWIPITMSLKCVPKNAIKNYPALAKIMAWCRPGIYSLLGLNEFIDNIGAIYHENTTIDRCRSCCQVLYLVIGKTWYRKIVHISESTWLDLKLLYDFEICRDTWQHCGRVKRV